MFFGILAMNAFNLADTWYVSQLGSEELAALSFTFPVVMLLNGITMGIGVGLTASISQLVGKDDMGQVRLFARDGLMLAMGIVVVFTFLGLATIDPIFRLLGAEPEIMPIIREYMRIWYLGAAAVVIPMVGNSAIRGTGDSVAPAWIMGIASVINIILDPLMIFGVGPFPEMGVKGAALATVIARVTTVFAALYILVVRDKLVSIKPPNMKRMIARWWHIFEVGGPAALTMIMLPVTAGILTKIIAVHGHEAVAAYGAGTRIEMFAMMLPVAVGTGLTVFVGQNAGAGRYDRMKRGISLSAKFVLVVSVVILGLIMLAAQPLAKAFADEEAVIAPLVLFLHIGIIGFVFDTLFSISVNSLNALRHAGRGLVYNLFRMFLFIIPLSWAGSTWYGLTGMFSGFAGGRMIAGILVYFVLWRWINRNYQESSTREVVL